MHSIKKIRSDLKSFENRIKQRNSEVDIKSIKSLDENNRKFIQKKEKLEQEKKSYFKIKG